MVTVGMNYEVLAGKEETFETVFRKVVKAMERIEGHGETHMFRDIDNARRYLIISQWTDKAAFDAFIASDSFRNITDWGKAQILTGRPKHEVYGT